MKKGNLKVKVLSVHEGDVMAGIKVGDIYKVYRKTDDGNYVVLLEKHCAILMKEQCEEMKYDEDVINHPNHYKGNKGIETIDFIENVLTREEFIGYLRGNIIKYQSRANLKGRKEEDLKKAKWYSDKLVEVLKDEN